MLKSEKDIEYSISFGAEVFDTGLVTTDADGKAFFNPTLNHNTGSNTIEVSYTCENGAEVKDQFSIEGSEEECDECKYTIEIVSGEDQVGCPGEELAEPIEISLTDEDGNIAKDKEVELSATKPNGSDISGNLSTQLLIIRDDKKNTVSFKLGDDEGTYIITAKFNCSENDKNRSVLLSRTDDDNYIEVSTEAYADREYCFHKVVFNFNNADKKPENYLPIKNDHVPFTIKIVPDDEEKIFKNGEKYNVNLWIRDTNGNEYSQNAKDQFVFQNMKYEYTVGSLSLNEESDEILLIPSNYYGVAQIHAQIQYQEIEDIIEIPIDTDDDLIADKWERDYPNNLQVGRNDYNTDNEFSNQETGDGITALNEYMGYYNVNTYHRLDPSIKEVFSNYKFTINSGIPNYLLSLGIKIIKINPGDYWFNGSQSKGIIKFRHGATRNSPRDDGIFTQNIGQSHTHDNMTLAGLNTEEPNGNGYGTIDVFYETINNLFDKKNNGIDNWVNESEHRIFRFWYYPPIAGCQATRIVFNGNDINGDNDRVDDLNILDITDDVPFDGHIWGFDENHLTNHVYLHELGHIFGLGENTNPQINSIMRQGLGSFKVFRYSATEVNNLRTY